MLTSAAGGQPCHDGNDGFNDERAWGAGQHRGHKPHAAADVHLQPHAAADAQQSRVCPLLVQPTDDGSGDAHAAGAKQYDIG